MTHAHLPLTSHEALSRVIGRLGLEEVARIAEREASTVYNWGNPTTREDVPFTIAIKLEVAYRANGGTEPAFLDTFRHLVGEGVDHSFADSLEVSRRLERALFESGEAFAAIAAVARHGADEATLIHALRETPEAIAELNAIVALIKAMREQRQARAPPG